MRYLTVFLLFLTVSCSSGSAKTPGDAGSHDTDLVGDGPPDRSSATDGNEVAPDGPCTGTLEQVQTAGFRGGQPACPATYGAVMQTPPGCGPMTRLVTYKPCGGFLVLLANCSLHGFYCVYDAVSSALVGSVVYDDIPTFCQRRSYCIQGGTLPAELQCTERGHLFNTCVLEAVDGGTVDATTADASDGPPSNG